MKNKLVGIVVFVILMSVLVIIYQQPISGVFSTLGPEWGLALVNGMLTVALVIISALHMVEAKKMRLESAKPVFSIQPADYFAGAETFMTLHLMNSGGTAKDVRIDVSYKNFKQQLYNSSIGTNERAPILFQSNPPFPKAGGVVKVKVECKDSYGIKHSEKLTINFNSLIKENRKMSYILSPLDLIARHLKNIEWKLRDIEHKIQT